MASIDCSSLMSSRVAQLPVDCIEDASELLHVVSVDNSRGGAGKYIDVGESSPRWTFGFEMILYAGYWGKILLFRRT